MTERVQLRNIRNGDIIGGFADYIEAATYRRDVLTPMLAQPWKNPWHIHYPDDPDYLAAQARFDEFCRESEKWIAELPGRPVQEEMFAMTDFIKGVS